jgi:hypothetical protein
VRLAFALRELEQRQRALDVDVVCRNRRELGARGQQCREMEDEIDLEFRQHSLEQVGIGDRSGELAIDQLVESRIERREIDRHDRPPAAGEPRDQAMADLSTGPGDERDRRAH